MKILMTGIYMVRIIVMLVIMLFMIIALVPTSILLGLVQMESPYKIFMSLNDDLGFLDVFKPSNIKEWVSDYYNDYDHAKERKELGN